MGLIHPGVPHELVLQLQAWFAVPTFVETGTYMGATAVWASAHFQKVYTFEASQTLWQETSTTYADRHNVTFIQGHSGERLQEVVAQISGPVLYWLDAHWSSGVTYGENDECPVLAELAAIQSHPGPHYILIDDARLFMAPPPSPHRIEQWPSISEVIDALNSTGPNPYIVIVEDVIIAVPDAARAQLATYLQQHPPVHAARSKPFDSRALLRRIRTRLGK